MEKVLAVPAYLDVVSGPTTEWMDKVVAPPGAPLGGLFAFGPSFADARRALAAMVWAAVTAGVEGVAASDFDAVRIFALTRKTYPVAGLAQETA